MWPFIECVLKQGPEAACYQGVGAVVGIFDLLLALVVALLGGAAVVWRSRTSEQEQPVPTQEPTPLPVPTQEPTPLPVPTQEPTPLPVLAPSSIIVTSIAPLQPNEPEFMSEDYLENMLVEWQLHAKLSDYTRISDKRSQASKDEL